MDFLSKMFMPAELSKFPGSGKCFTNLCTLTYGNETRQEYPWLVVLWCQWSSSYGEEEILTVLLAILGAD
jgi:hypothetical protein